MPPTSPPKKPKVANRPNSPATPNASPSCSSATRRSLRCCLRRSQNALRAANRWPRKLINVPQGRTRMSHYHLLVTGARVLIVLTFACAAGCQSQTDSAGAREQARQDQRVTPLSVAKHVAAARAAALMGDQKAVRQNVQGMANDMLHDAHIPDASPAHQSRSSARGRATAGGRALGGVDRPRQSSGHGWRCAVPQHGHGRSSLRCACATGGHDGRGGERAGRDGHDLRGRGRGLAQLPVAGRATCILAAETANRSARPCDPEGLRGAAGFIVSLNRVWLSIPATFVRRHGRARWLAPFLTRRHDMRFLSLIRVRENTGQKPSEKLMADMGQLIAEMTADGTLLDTAGLRPTSEGKRVRLTYGKQSASDGPFTEAKEVIGGYALLKADSMEHALQLTKRFLDVHGDESEVECELRQLDPACEPAA